MIIRALRLRHGRIALPKVPLPSRRWYAVETTDSTTVSEAPIFIESTPQKQLNAIEGVRSVQINDPTDPVAQDYAFFQHQRARTAHLGTAIAPHYRPNQLLSNPPRPKDITLELLLASQAHIGHSTSLWHPANARYIFGVRGRKQDGEAPIHVISLETTAAHLRRACKIVSGVAERGGLVLFVGTRAGQARAVVRAAELSKGCHLFTKWIPGSITNGQQILGRCAKKVINEHDQDVAGFDDQLHVKAAVKPDLVVCLNPMENYTLLHECGLNNIPTIGIVDTNCNPTWVTYPIPANDDSLRCVQVIAGVLGRAGEEGQAKRASLAEQGYITYAATHGLNPPKKQRASQAKPPQSQRKQRATLPAEEPNFPEDFEGVDVKQNQADQKLLEDAEKAMLEQGGASFHASTSETNQDLSLAEETEDDVYSSSPEIDQSLLDESYSQEDFSDEDLQQFGGIEQLSQNSAKATQPMEANEAAEPSVQATQAPGTSSSESISSWAQSDSVASEATHPATDRGDIGDKQATQPMDAAPEAPPALEGEGESVMDQVGEVEKELGEDSAPPVPEPELNRVNVEDAAKDEPPVTGDGASKTR